MEVVVEDVVFPPPPPPPEQQLTRITTCDRHPDVPVIGLCALCLRERLVDLEVTRFHKPDSSSNSSAAAVLKSIFFRQPPPPSSSNGNNHHRQQQREQQSQLRRCRSFSAGRRDGSYATPRASSFEPQRRSCDVRGRNTLWSLFHQDDTLRHSRDRRPNGGGDLESECRNLGFAPPAPKESKEEDDEEDFQDAIGGNDSSKLPIQEEEEEEEMEEQVVVEEARRIREEAEDIDGEDMIISEEIVQTVEEQAERKPIKEHIDLEQPKKPPAKDLKEIAGSFWLAASVFSKRLQKWRRKQKLKKQQQSLDKQQQQQQQQRDAYLSSSHKPPSSSSSSSLRFPRRSLDMPDDVFGPRRSCDVFSMDAGRMSLDDPRGSWEEPRASWDGYLLGGRSVFFSRQPPPPVLEDTNTNNPAIVPRSDGLIPVEEDLHTPGGTLQARDYYGDFPQRRRRSLDRSTSIHRRTMPLDHEASIPIANGNGSARVSFELGANESFHHSTTSLRDEWSDSFDSTYRDPPKELPSKSRRRWSKPWNIWAFIHRRSSDRTRNMVGRSLSENWPELRADQVSSNSRRVLRSNSNLSSRSWHANNGLRSNSGLHMDINGGQWHNKKRRDAHGLERNRSARYSPANNADSSGMLRFYLPPMRSGRPGAKKSIKEGLRSSNSFTRSVLQLY